MNKRVVAIRGATCCDNTKAEIQEYVCKMFNEIVTKNDLTKNDIISIQFSITKDITVMNPATALRLGDTRIDVSEIPLFCCQEAEIDGALEYVVRVLVTTYMKEFSPRTNVYINGAERLRPDFYKDK